jgi:NAD+ synthase
VKLGSGAADVKPIAALYKTQTYDLARHLGVIEEILTRVPTADTYSLDQSQEESYFSVHHGQLDLILWARNHKVPAATVSRELGYTVEQIERVYRDIEQKRRSSAYRHAPALMLEEVADLKPFAIR